MLNAECQMGLSECAMTRRARRAKPHPAFSASRSTSDRTGLRGGNETEAALIGQRAADVA